MTTERKEKTDWYRNLNRYANKGGILFAGSSFVADFPVNELEVNFQLDAPVYNRGMRELTVKELLETALDVCVLDLQPTKLFLSLGETDCKQPNFSLDEFLTQYEMLLTRIQSALPNCSVFVIGLLPACRDYETINGRLRQLVKEQHCTFLDFSLALLNQKENILLEGEREVLAPASYVTILKELKHLFRNEEMGFGEVWNMISNWY